MSNVPSHCQLELTPGRRDFTEVENPVALERVFSLISGWNQGWPGVHHSLSVTGGEPLLQVETLKSWLVELKGLLPIHLETNGTLWEALAEVISHLEWVGMDIKLPSATGGDALWHEHERFLRIASQKKVYVKAVVGPETQPWEIERSCAIVAARDRSIPLILQPMTLPTGAISVSSLRMLELQELAASLLDEVRVIPQTHKFMGQL
jgi:organic radical activating enzyme